MTTTGALSIHIIGALSAARCGLKIWRDPDCYDVRASRSASGIQGGRSPAAEMSWTKCYTGTVPAVVGLSGLGCALQAARWPRLRERRRTRRLPSNRYISTYVLSKRNPICEPVLATSAWGLRSLCFRCAVLRARRLLCASSSALQLRQKSRSFRGDAARHG
jgi:hypothetical protein